MTINSLFFRFIRNALTRIGDNVRNVIYDSDDDTEGPPHGATGARIETNSSQVENRIVERIAKTEPDRKLEAQRTLSKREAVKKEVQKRKPKIIVEGTPTPKKTLSQAGFEPGTPDSDAKVVFVPETPTYESHPGSNRDDETSLSSEIPETPARGYTIWVQESPAPTHLGATPKTRSPVRVKYIVETPENRRSGDISEKSSSGLSTPGRYINTVPKKSVPRAPKSPKSPREPSQKGNGGYDTQESQFFENSNQNKSRFEKVFTDLAKDLSARLEKAEQA